MGERVEIEAELVPTSSMGTSALSAVTRGELDVQISTAKTYPRDERLFIQSSIRWATEDPETAESCVYSRYVRDRDGKEVEIRGPSIRMAEIIAQAYGNLRVASRMVAELEKFVVVEAVAHDLERNNAQRAEVVVSIWSTKWKKRFSQDVIQSNILAAQAKARRNAILAVVPGAWVRKIMQEVEAVNRKEQSSLGDRVEKMASYLQNRLHVEIKDVLAVVRKTSLEQLTNDDLIRIRSLVDDIQEGTLSIAQAFPTEAELEKPQAKPAAKEAQGLQDMVDAGSSSPAAVASPSSTPPSTTDSAPTGTPAKPQASPEESSSPAEAPKPKSSSESKPENTTQRLRRLANGLKAEGVVKTQREGIGKLKPYLDAKPDATDEELLVAVDKGGIVTTQPAPTGEGVHPWATAENEDLDGHIAHLEDTAAAVNAELISQAQEAAPGSLDPDATPEQLRAYCDALHAGIALATK